MEKFIWPDMRRHYILEHLKAHGKNQEWLAGQMNVKPGSVSRWINDPGRVDMHILSAVADILGMKRVGDLLHPPKQSARAVLQDALDALPEENGEGSAEHLMGTIQAQRYCPQCQRQVLAVRQTPNHILHLLLSIFLLGIWLIVWFIIALSSEPWLCPVCGGKTQPTEMPEKPLIVERGNPRAWVWIVAVLAILIGIIAWNMSDPR